MERILIVEDDGKIAQLESDYLISSGYETKIIMNGNDVKQALEKDSYDLIVLDVMLPGCNGYDICREIRDMYDIPILMVTARSENMDIIRGLGLGADDYITKPFDPSEFATRVRTHLKRYQRLTHQKEKEIIVQDLLIEKNKHKVFKNGSELKLPNKEFELLYYLCSNPNIVFSKGQLLEKIWGYDSLGDDATVSVHINRLREKIEDDPRNPKIIETVWGVGYRIIK